MNRRSATFGSAAGIAIVVFVLAFVAAPRSCDGGLELYFWSGVVALLILLALPFVTPMPGSILSRVGWSCGFVLLGAAVWLAGLFAANVRILCRLF